MSIYKGKITYAKYSGNDNTKTNNIPSLCSQCLCGNKQNSSRMAIMKYIQHVLNITITLLVFTVIGCSNVPVDTCSVRGQVMLCGAGMEGVTVEITHPEHGTTSTVTGENGMYRFDQAWDGSYTVRPVMEGYVFLPAEQQVTVHDDTVVDDFDAVTSWDRMYGGDGWERAYAVTQDSDCGYIVAGYTSESEESFNPIVMKLDQFGELIWTYTHTDALSGAAYAITISSDGGYVAAGCQEVEGKSGELWVAKLNGNGELVWSHTYGDDLWDEARSISPTADGGFIIAGSIEYSDNRRTECYILKISATGDYLWERQYGDQDSDDVANDIRQTGDGGYILAGYSEFFNSSLSNPWILKLNSDGYEDWRWEDDIDYRDEAYSVIHYSGGGYVATGYSMTEDQYSRMWVARLDESGNELWMKEYDEGETRRAHVIRETFNGALMLGGYRWSGQFSEKDMLIAKLTPDGEKQWEKSWGAGNYGDDEVLSMGCACDEGYFMAGYTRTINELENMRLIKVDAWGNIHTTQSAGE